MSTQSKTCSHQPLALCTSQPGQVGLNLLLCALCPFLSQDRSDSTSCPVHSACALCLFLSQDRLDSTSCPVLSVFFSARTGRSQPPVASFWLALAVCFLSQDRSDSFCCLCIRLAFSVFFSARTGWSQPPVLCTLLFFSQDRMESTSCPLHSAGALCLFSQPGQVGLNLMPCALCPFLSHDRSESTSCPVHLAGTLCFFLNQDKPESTSCRHSALFSQPGQVGVNL